ncbi:MAG: MFS transporter [Pseudomonadota bacterium]
MLRRRSLFFYGLLAAPLSFAGLPLYLHAPDYYATELSVSLAALGTVLLLLRIVDAVQDPLIGWISDRFARHRQSIVVAGGVLLMLGFWMLFHPLDGQYLIWFAVSVFICSTGFSIVSINYQALGGLWRTSDAQRTRITGWREGVGLLGLLTAAAMPTVLMRWYSDADSFHIVSLMLLVLLIVAGVLFRFWWKQTELTELRAGSDESSWWDDFRRIWLDPWHRHFYPLFLLNSLSAAVPGVLVLFFIRDLLGAEQLGGLFLLLYFASGASAMVLWHGVAVRIGKYRAWLASMVLAIVTFIGAFAMGPGDIVAFAIICVLSGTALGGDLALPPAILADKMNEAGTVRRASSLYAMMAFLSKAGLALATGLTLPALDFVGFVPGTAATGSTALALSIAYALVPCVLKAVCAVWIWRRFC